MPAAAVDNVVLPLPPLTVSLPNWPRTKSLPLPPLSVSLPSPPLRPSLPPPPSSRSLPARPNRPSLPARPRRMPPASAGLHLVVEGRADHALNAEEHVARGVAADGGDDARQIDQHPRSRVAIAREVEAAAAEQLVGAGAALEVCRRHSRPRPKISSARLVPLSVLLPLLPLMMAMVQTPSCRCPWLGRPSNPGGWRTAVSLRCRAEGARGYLVAGGEAL